MSRRSKFISFPYLLICLFNINMLLVDRVVAENTTVQVNVGVILDMDSLAGKIGWSCIHMAISDFYDTHAHYKTRLILHNRDAKEDVVLASAAALDLIKNVKVQAIVGPTSTLQANFVTSMGNKSQVPIISFSAKSPSLASLQSPYFFLAAQNASSQVEAIKAIVEHFGWREAVLVYIDNQFCESLIPYLTDALQEINTRIKNRSIIPESASDDQIVTKLYKLKNTQTRLFIVHMTMTLGSRILAKAKEMGMMSEGYVWIMTDTMTTLLRSIDASVVDSVEGVLGVRAYVNKSENLEDFRFRWKKKFMQDNPDALNADLNILGLWAYDATYALAMAIEKAGTANLQFNKTNGVTQLETLGISQNGPQLVQELSSVKFRGLSGDFEFVNGQVQSSVCQIVNVHGNVERTVGFWTSQNGLLRRLKLTNTSTNSSADPKLGPIIWPGETTSVPKGWEIPDGRKLRILVPVKVDFRGFVNVLWDPVAQKATSIQGYCIDVFNAVMAKMPYAVDYEFVPFITPDGKPAGSYNDLIDQIYYGNFDVAVGDISMVANRSLYVEFSLPYMESDLVTVVPIRDNKEKKAWIFLKPLTGDLWAASGCFFVFIAFVVWILEHRINEDFRGPLAQQLGTSFWFSFSTLILAHRERVISNLSRFVVIIWCVVVLILTQCYTANLASLLTVKQLQPTVTDINDILRRGENIGFVDGSHVKRTLLLDLKFDEFQLKTYKSPEELDDLFTKGSANGGISASLDEAPYAKHFLAKYCGKYTTLDSKPCKFDGFGFGFVFPKRSPLVADVSRAILNASQGGEIKQIENKWFNKNTCSDNPSDSNRLGLESFRGLFLIAGVASISALLIFAAMFLYEQRNVCRSIRIASRIFDQKDLSSHTSRKTEVMGATSPCTVHGQGGFTGHDDLDPSASASTEICPSPRRSSIELTEMTL